MNTPLTLGKIITLVLSLKDPFYRKHLNRLNHPERSHTLENNKTNGRDLLFPASVFRCPHFLNWGIELKDFANHQRRGKAPKSRAAAAPAHPIEPSLPTEEALGDSTEDYGKRHFSVWRCPHVTSKASQQPAGTQTFTPSTQKPSAR